MNNLITHRTLHPSPKEKRDFGKILVCHLLLLILHSYPHDKKELSAFFFFFVSEVQRLTLP